MPDVEFVSEDEAADLAKVEYLTSTGCPRFDFLRGASRHSEGIILHIGCNEDPAMLKALFGGRIYNCDRTAYDETMHRRNRVDKVFDFVNGIWPFAEDSAELVLFNDCFNDMPQDRIVWMLEEAHRVAQRIAITVPEDHRTDEALVVTQGYLRRLLQLTGWHPFVFLEADWMFGDVDPPVMGWLVEAYSV